MYRGKLSTLPGLAMAGLFALGTSGFAVAQSTTNSQSTTTTTTESNHQTTSITGCLQKGDGSNQYSMKTSDGKTYGLKSTKVQLSEHVGHNVALTGFITPESAEGSEANGNASGMGNANSSGSASQTSSGTANANTSGTANGSPSGNSSATAGGNPSGTESGASSGMDKGGDMDMTVTSLQMISTSCPAQ